MWTIQSEKYRKGSKVLKKFFSFKSIWEKHVTTHMWKSFLAHGSTYNIAKPHLITRGAGDIFLSNIRKKLKEM